MITYTGHGKTFKNVVHGFLSGGYTLADLTALAVAVDAEVTASWLPAQSLDYLYVSTTVRGLAFENDQEVTVTTGTALGALAAAALPDNVTLAIKKASAFTGRTARGRLYWIGTALTQISTNESQYSVVGANTIRDAVDDMRAAITATVWQATIVSRFAAGLKRPFGVTTDWIDSVLVDINVDSQRRRLR